MGVALMCLSAQATAFHTTNVVFITDLNASPNPFDPDVEQSTVSIGTFEFAEWFWLSPSTMVRPSIFVNVAGRVLPGTMVSEQLSPLGFFGVPPFLFWFNQTGEWSHTVVWDGINSTGDTVAPGPHLATINVFAGGATTFGSIVLETRQDRQLDLVLSAPNVAPDGTVTLSVVATDRQGNPVPNFGVELEATAPAYTVEPCADCGGHSHDGGRPVGVFISALGVPLGSTTQGNTGPNGEPLVLSYRAESFGGVDTIRATSLAQPAVQDMERLTVTVGGLAPLANSADYVKIGGTTRHRGPPNFALDNNHYGTVTMLQAIATLASRHRARYTQLLMINDISLEYGGGFDINGGWHADIDDADPTRAGCQPLVGHCTHRLGRNVDVADLTADGFLVDPFWLEAEVRSLGGTFLAERTHFHLTF